MNNQQKVNNIEVDSGLINDNTPSIMSVNALLGDRQLVIPSYQRPYKWTGKNITALIQDIQQSIRNQKSYSEFKYRIGTVILHKNENKDKNKEELEVVDGQQRILSLLLLKLYLDSATDCSLLQNFKPSNKVTQKNLHDNYMIIQDQLSSLNQEEKEDLKKAFEEILEVVVISVQKQDEAFQLFDSQNSRGRALYPHDLLKAYHLREMHDKYEMQRAVEKWEAQEPRAIRELFDLYLYPIWNWSKLRKTSNFTAAEIEVYKGINEASGYTYACRASQASPYFLLTAPFTSGADFFEMVSHYLQMLHDIKEEIVTNPGFGQIKIILVEGNATDSVEELDQHLSKTPIGLSYAHRLFFCALLCYYDRFHNFDTIAVKKLFTWAMMLRVDMQTLGFASINRYAIGEDGYSNAIPMISIISSARRHTEISSIRLNLTDRGNSKWAPLLEKIKDLNGYGSSQDD